MLKPFFPLWENPFSAVCLCTCVRVNFKHWLISFLLHSAHNSAKVSVGNNTIHFWHIQIWSLYLKLPVIFCFWLPLYYRVNTHTHIPHTHWYDVHMCLHWEIKTKNIKYITISGRWYIHCYIHRHWTISILIDTDITLARCFVSSVCCLLFFWGDWCLI